MSNLTAAAALPRLDDAELRTAHDVRTLRLCGSCGGLGNKHRMLSGLKDSASLDGWHHGRCVVHRLGAEGVLKLPAVERAKLTLADTGVELMHALLDAPSGNVENA